MPDISLLEPTVLRGVVQKMTAPETMVMLNRTTRTPYPFPSVTWDVIRGSRQMAKPNVPNSEGHIVNQLGRTQESASFVYLREKKVFKPTTLHWLREPGEIARVNAEAAVLREIGDLNVRFDNFAEYCIWQALTGTLNITYPDGATVTVDYKLPASHKPSVGTSWASATPQQIVADVRAWKVRALKDGRVPINEAFATTSTIAYIFDSFAAAGATNLPAGNIMSDRMKQSYYESGIIPGFMGLQWGAVETIYETDAGVETNFVREDSLFIGNFTENTPIELFEGPTADDSAPTGFTGKFSKTWKEEDPSARQYLMEWNMLPVITRPEQFIYVADVTA